MPQALTLAKTLPDGTTAYLRDDPDGRRARQTLDPFQARPFPDLVTLEDYLKIHPEIRRDELQVVPWPIDLDRAVPTPTPDREPTGPRIGAAGDASNTDPDPNPPNRRQSRMF